MEEYGGLLRRMPWTGVFFLIGAVSISALPPTNGFVSEWLVFQSLFLSFQHPGPLFETDVADCRRDAGSDRGVGAGLFREGLRDFVSGAATKHACSPRGGSAVVNAIGMGLLAVVCMLLGWRLWWSSRCWTGSGTICGRVDRGKVLALDGWALAPVNVEFSSLSTPVLALLLVALSMLGLGLVVASVGLRSKRYYKTWGCGINLTPRMEYTATGFVQPIKRVFSTIYQPTVKLETEFLEESRYFTKRRRFEFHIEPIFQKYLYDPVVVFFTTMADRLRVIQAGSLHLYLTYIFVTLVLLLLLF